MTAARRLAADVVRFPTQSRRPRPRSATSAIRRLETSLERRKAQIAVIAKWCSKTGQNDPNATFRF